LPRSARRSSSLSGPHKNPLQLSRSWAVLSPGDNLIPFRSPPCLRCLRAFFVLMVHGDPQVVIGLTSHCLTRFPFRSYLPSAITVSLTGSVISSTQGRGGRPSSLRRFRPASFFSLTRSFPCVLILWPPFHARQFLPEWCHDNSSPTLSCAIHPLSVCVFFLLRRSGSPPIHFLKRSDASGSRGSFKLRPPPRTPGSPTPTFSPTLSGPAALFPRNSSSGSSCRIPSDFLAFPVYLRCVLSLKRFTPPLSL